MKKWLVGLLCLVSVAAWADEEKPVFTAPVPSDQAVLKMGLDAFEKWGDSHHRGDSPTYAWCDEHYYKLREADNAQAEKALGKEAVQALDTAYKDVSNWKSYRIQAKRAQAGGTLYEMAAFHEQGVVADLIGQSIRQWNQSAPDSATYLDPVKPFAAAGSKPGQFSGSTQKEYDAALKDEAGSLPAAKAAVKALPSGPRALFAKYLKNTADGYAPGNR